MQQIRCFGDDRNKGFCVHCGRPDETRDHVPSKIFLDEPYPENLPVLPSCLRCNNDLSIHEEYLACLLECILVGTTEPSKLKRSRVAAVLNQKPLLLERLRKAKSDLDGVPSWSVEDDRIRAVVLKLARGHAAYELNEPRIDAPTHIDFRPFPTMSDSEREAFEDLATGAALAPWPEVGTRALQRLFIVESEIYEQGWLDVQESNYRFQVSQQDGLTVRFVLREYLACRVVW
jgi:hypothetical protein